MLRHRSPDEEAGFVPLSVSQFETELQWAIAARQANALAQAVALIERLLLSNPTDERVITESLLLSCQVNDPHLAITALRRAATMRGTPLDHAMALAATTIFNTLQAPVGVNIGGGPFFQAPLWKNIDGVAGPANPFPIELRPDTVFPVETASVEFVYSSHCLEHLDDATVAQILREARRILHPQGYLVLKIPDFEQVLRRWQNGDDHFFSDQHWNFQSVEPYMQQRGITQDRDYRAAMIFCGFWNAAHGDPFAGGEAHTPHAYHGPATPPRAFLHNLLSTQTPHVISQQLVAWVRNTEASYTFNHQNAWSRDELREVLQSSGFEIQSFEREKIVHFFQEIPTIEEMYKISLYCAATPQTHA